jgi:hypothetical protein
MRLESQVNEGVRLGLIGATEERGLRWEIRDFRRTVRQYSYNGLSWQEQRDLQSRLRSVGASLQMVDNRYDRINRYSGQGGPIEEIDSCRDHGLSGVVNSLIGHSCYRVGDRVDRNLYAVPSGFRDQYRDSDFVYYRYDGDLIYAIDPTTNRVVSSFGTR